jgi:hypothetical protein
MAKLTTAEVAKEYRVSEEYVREHASEMGGRRLGSSRRSPLRFDSTDLDRWWSSLPIGAAAEPRKPQRPGPRRVPSGVKLFPVGVDD